MSREIRAAPGPRVGEKRPPWGRVGRCPGVPPGWDIRSAGRIGRCHPREPSVIPAKAGTSRHHPEVPAFAGMPAPMRRVQSSARLHHGESRPTGMASVQCGQPIGCPARGATPGSARPAPPRSMAAGASRPPSGRAPPSFSRSGDARDPLGSAASGQIAPPTGTESVCSRLFFRQIRLRADELESH